MLIVVHVQRDSAVDRGAMGETEMKIDVGFSGTAVGDLKGFVVNGLHVVLR